MSDEPVLLVERTDECTPKLNPTRSPKLTMELRQRQRRSTARRNLA
jgi:hypothetical protein